MEKVGCIMRGNVGLRVWAGLILAAALPAISSASIIEGPIVNPENGHLYYLLSQDSWTDSEAQAEAMGGHLATVRNAAENHWIWDTFSPFFDGNLWIGLEISGVNPSQWAWVSGEPVTYTNWSPTDPDGPFPSYTELPQRYFTQAYNIPYEWDDIYNSGVDFQNISSFGVVEVLPEPASLALFASAVLATMTARRRNAVR